MPSSNFCTYFDTGESSNVDGKAKFVSIETLFLLAALPVNAGVVGDRGSVSSFPDEIWTVEKSYAILLAVVFSSLGSGDELLKGRSMMNDDLNRDDICFVPVCRRVRDRVVRRW